MFVAKSCGLWLHGGARSPNDVAESNRLSGASKRVRKRIDAHIRWLEAELARADKDLDQNIAQSPIWREKEDLLKSVPVQAT